MKDTVVGCLVGLIMGFVTAAGLFGPVKREYVSAGVMIVDGKAYSVKEVSRP